MTGYVAAFGGVILLMVGVITIILPYLLIIGIPALIACLVYRRYVQNKEREIQYARLKDMRKETNDFMNENEVK